MRKLLPLFILTAALGCDVGAGKYTVIRLAVADSSLSDSCYFMNMPDPDVVDDDINVRAGSTIAIFPSDKESFWLEWGPVSIPGSKDGSAFSFAATDTDLTVVGDSRRTEVTEHDVTMELKGGAVDGTYTNTYTCSGEGCPISSCVTTTTFVGAVVRDVDVTHEL
ncbi:MAG: hypothetical protein IPK80_16810 [Nannocystis sp.]|nr:hypothetical protein [Nannocystis sp.]